MVSPVVDLVHIISFVERRQVGKGITMLDIFDAVYVQICGHRSKLLHWSMERAPRYESAKCFLEAILARLGKDFNCKSSASGGKGTKAFFLVSFKASTMPIYLDAFSTSSSPSLLPPAPFGFAIQKIGRWSNLLSVFNHNLP